MQALQLADKRISKMHCRPLEKRLTIYLKRRILYGNKGPNKDGSKKGIEIQAISTSVQLRDGKRT